MLSNPLETLSYYKHGEQQCQPAPCASTYRPTPFPQAHTIPQPSPPIMETLTQPKWSGPHPGSPALPVALLTPQELRASANTHYIPLYMLMPRAQGAIFPYSLPFARTPPVLQLENLIKGELALTEYLRLLSLFSLVACLKHDLPEQVLQGPRNTYFVRAAAKQGGDFVAALLGSTATDQALTVRPVNTKRTQAFFFLPPSRFFFLSSFTQNKVIWAN